MRILLANDDGIHARGLRELARHLGAVHQVTVVAPAAERSGVGCLLTLDRALNVASVPVEGAGAAFAVDGSPVDCVKLALAALAPEPPELVVSGVNLGANVGINVFYSGTVAAALEAASAGLPAMAVSLATFAANADFGPAARAALRLVDFFARVGLPPGHLLNVNVPAVPEGELRGFRVTAHGRARYLDGYQGSIETGLYRLDGGALAGVGGLESDAGAIERGYISVSPLQLDMSASHLAGELARWQFLTR